MRSYETVYRLAVTPLYTAPLCPRLQHSEPAAVLLREELFVVRQVVKRVEDINFSGSSNK